MKALRNLLVVFLVLVIIGGLGYIGYSMFFMPMNHDGTTGMGNMPGMNSSGSTAPTQQTTNNNQQGGNTQTTQNNRQTGNTQQNISQNNAPLNTAAIQNKDKLNQAITTINQAIEMISIDPYAKTTVPNSSNTSGGNMQTQSNQGSGTVNVFPSGNSTVNVVPPGNNTTNNTASSTNTNMGTMAGQQNINYVYDQGKLQQLNNGIYTLAQGIMAVNQLNDDLTSQSAMIEATPPDYQTYVNRYNTALQNMTRLNNAITMIDKASTLVNVNPYASPNGYQINVSEMQSLHQGIYKLAQGMTMLNRLNDDFLQQMSQAAAQAQALASNSMSNMAGMNMTGTGWNINLATVFNIVLVIMVIGLIIGIFGAIVSLFKKKPKAGGDGNPGNEPNIF